MSVFTTLWNLLKKNPATDGADTFNIETMLNDNWDKIDAALGLKAINAEVRAATTANITISGLQTVDGVALAAGDRVLVKNQTTASQNGIYTAAEGTWTRAADADQSGKLASGLSVFVKEGTSNGKKQWRLSTTGSIVLGTTALTFELVSGAGSATDAVVGNRTITDTTAPAGDSGTLTGLFGGLGYMIKAITGKSSWRTAPATTLEAAKGHMDATTGAHGATAAATANAIMQRDAAGRAKVAAPSASDDIARKAEVDAAITSAATDATTKANGVQANLSAHVGSGGAAHAAATTSVAGFMSAGDKSKLDGIAAGANNYSHPTGDGNLHVPATGTTNNAKVLKAGSTAGSAAWGNVAFSEVTGKPTTLSGYGITDAAPSSHVGSGGTAHAAATASAAGFMSAGDKSKLDGIATGANNYTHPTGDGNLHVPATGTSNNAKVLKAGSTAGSIAWGNVAFSELTGRPTTLSGYGIVDSVPSSHVGAGGAAHAAATMSAAGFMSAMDKVKLDKLAVTNQLVNNVDLNTVTQTGFHRLNGTHPNSPPDVGYSQMLVLQASGDTIVQIIVRYNTAQIYIRSGNPSSLGGPTEGGWTSWKTTAMTDNPVFTGEISIQGDGQGVSFYDGTRLYKRIGGAVTIRKAPSEFDPEIESNNGQNRWPIWHSGNSPLNASPNGYQKLNSGLIIQWGRVPSVATMSSTTVTFPITFPTSLRSVIATVETTGAAAGGIANVFNLNYESTTS
ncbi:pyocin knob domain-containing protein [Cohnella massiliensis]|uniref:pyocin knob domain-containing protein n=1 Tax=Cohnella massiliensis TaxID=1816691 RepID=UPI0009BAD94D|nr:pyocin knob domain-containing protein [Cohnella massiliensis]